MAKKRMADYVYHFKDGRSIDLKMVYKERGGCSCGLHADDIAMLIRVITQKDALIEQLDVPLDRLE